MELKIAGTMDSFDNRRMWNLTHHIFYLPSEWEPWLIQQLCFIASNGAFH